MVAGTTSGINLAGVYPREIPCRVMKIEPTAGVSRVGAGGFAAVGRKAAVSVVALMVLFLKRIFQFDYQPTIVDDYEGSSSIKQSLYFLN